MKKSVIALILFAVLIIIVSPGIVGKLAEESVGENLNWAAKESGELVVTSEGFDRGWFSSEGQHRIALGNGRLRSAITTATGSDLDEQIPVLLINTHIDHGLIPVTSMSRAEGSLVPGIGRAVSTLAVEYDGDQVMDVPGVIYTKIGLGGDLDSRFVLAAGTMLVDGGEVTWQPTTINVASSAISGEIELDGDIGAMTFGNNQQVVSFDGVKIVATQAPTDYGFRVGEGEITIGPMSVESGGITTGGMQGLSIRGSSSVDDGLAAATMHFEMSGQTIPEFGDISVIADMGFSGVDAMALGALSRRLESLQGTQGPNQIMLAAKEELMALFAAGIDINVDQFDVALPMGTVQMKMTLSVPGSDAAAFAWSSLLLAAVLSVDIMVPEALVQLATSVNPQTGALIGLGYLKKDGDAYIMDADLKKGLLTINGAPIPIPLGAFQ